MQSLSKESIKQLASFDSSTNSKGDLIIISEALKQPVIRGKVARKQRHNNGKFNVSMQFHTKELSKFERHVDDYFCDNEGLHNRYKSIDGAPILSQMHDETPIKQSFYNEDIVRMASKEKQRTKRIKRNMPVHDTFPSVKLYQSVGPSQKLPSISTNANSVFNTNVDFDGSSLVTQRKLKYTQRQNDLKEAQKKIGLKDVENFTFSSQHNKFNRVRDGGWGTKQPSPAIVLPAVRTINQQDQKQMLETSRELESQRSPNFMQTYPVQLRQSYDCQRTETTINHNSYHPDREITISHREIDSLKVPQNDMTQASKTIIQQASQKSALLSKSAMGGVTDAS